MVVGDEAVAGVPQVTQSIQAISTQTVMTSLTFPADTPANVIVVLPSASVSPSDQANVRKYLSIGGDVVLIGSAVRKLRE